MPLGVLGLFGGGCVQRECVGVVGIGTLEGEFTLEDLLEWIRFRECRFSPFWCTFAGRIVPPGSPGILSGARFSRG